MSRAITTHHDGHGLNESIVIEADGPGPGGASHRYLVFVPDPDMQEVWRLAGLAGPARREVAEIQYQKGPRGETGSKPGVLDGVLLAIVRDRMESFQAGPFACEANATVLEHVTAAMKALKDRADERADRGVLGKNAK